MRGEGEIKQKIAGFELVSTDLFLRREAPYPLGHGGDVDVTVNKQKDSKMNSWYKND